MKIKLGDVLEALEFVNDEIEYYYNPENGEIFLSNIGEFSDMNEDELDELFDNSIMLPTRYDINEYSIMEEFIEVIDDVKLRNQLLTSINGKGAFRRFKDTCINFNIIDNWYKYRDNRYKEIAIEWCNKYNIEIIE